MSLVAAQHDVHAGLDASVLDRGAAPVLELTALAPVFDFTAVEHLLDFTALTPVLDFAIHVLDPIPLASVLVIFPPVLVSLTVPVLLLTIGDSEGNLLGFEQPMGGRAAAIPRTK